MADMFLGVMCKRGHDHEGTGKTQRYITSRACVACQLSHHNPAHNKGRRRSSTAVRTWRLLRTYGITPADYERMLAEQGDGCAICGSTEPGGSCAFFHVDHDHKTGRVRGLLCAACNTSLGGFKDDAALLRRAAEYVSNDPGGTDRNVHTDDGPASSENTP